MKIKVFYHLNDSPGFEHVMSSQLTKMSESGLLDAASEVFMCTNGNEMSFAPAQTVLAEYPNCKFVHTSNRRDLWEFPTLDLLKRNCQSSMEEFYVLYIHLKGLSRPNDPTVRDWREFMDYANIERWEDCVDVLDQNYDTVGANFIEAPWAHYSGNFWWARASYIRKLDALKDPMNTPWGTPSPYTGAVYDIGNFRYDHEAWIGTGNPVWAEVATSPGKQDTGWHFRNQYPRSQYAAS